MRINPDLKGLIRFLKSVRTGKIHQSEKQLRWNLAQRVARLVRQKYRTYESEPSNTERMTIEAGKDQGAVRRPRQPRAPINIFALLAANVIARTGYWEDTYLVEIDRSAAMPDASGPRPGGHDYPGGIPLGLMAYWIEYPKPYTVRMTLRQLGYLYAVREGRAGPGTRKVNRHLPDQSTAYSYIFDPPQRPVWQTVTKEIMRLTDRLYGQPLVNLMRQEGKGYGIMPVGGLRFRL